MCNTRRDPNNRKERVNGEPIVNFKTMEIQNNENKRKAIVLIEPDVETKNSKSLNNIDVAEEESTNSTKQISPFLLLGFIIDPNKRIKHAYSCNFCSRKFINQKALGGHQKCHRLEKRLKKRVEDMNNDLIKYPNGTQGVVSQNTIIPYQGGYGYQYNGYGNMIQHSASSNFHAGNLLGELQHIPQIDEVINEVDQNILSPQIIVSEFDYVSVSNGATDDGDDVDHEDKETWEEEESKIDLTLKL